MDAELPVRTDLYDEPEDLAAAIPGTRMRATPLASGAFHARIVTWALDGLVFQAGTCTPLAFELAVGAEFSAVQVPLRNRQALLLNGRAVPDHAVGLYGGGAALLRGNRLASTYATLVLPMQSAETLLCPPAGLALTRPGASCLLTTRADAWTRLARMIDTAAGANLGAPGELAASAPRAGLRASLLEVVRAVLAHGRDGEPARRVNASRGWIGIVRGAEAYLQAHADRAIYTEELCAHLGVSPASLGVAFRQVLGTTPHRFLKLRRLAMVRSVLRSTEGPPPLVKTAALDHGFWHLGQFALDYRAMYGETPSATLTRARGWASRPTRLAAE